MATFSMYINGATNEMLGAKIDERLDFWASHFNLERALVHAVAQVESKKKFAAIRVEPHLKRAKWYRRVLPEEQLTNDLAYCSMGLMQVLYGVAVDQGFQGTPMELMDIDNAIEHGCIKLSKLIKAHFYLNKVISSYNQGSPRKTRVDGKLVFKNQGYVDKVLKAYRKLGGLH